MNFSAAELAVLESGSQRLGVFFRLAVAPVARLWLGVGACAPGINARDPSDGGFYDGIGELPDVPEFDQIMNGGAQRVEFTLSGVSTRLLALASAEANLVRDKELDLGLGILGADWQPLAAVHWLWRGYGDFVTIAREPAADAKGITTQSVRLSAGTLMTGRRRGRNSYWIDQDQQRRSPGDKFFERTALYRQEVHKIWPRF